jgi:hypothetical protein
MHESTISRNVGGLQGLPRFNGDPVRHVAD